MKYIKHFLEQSWLLMVGAFVFGLLLAMTNSTLKDKIKQNETELLNQSMKGLLSSAESFEVIVEDAVIAGNYTNIYKATNNKGDKVGFVFVGTGSGFADKIKLAIAVDEMCKRFMGFDVLYSNETPGFGSRITEQWFVDQFVGAPAHTLELVKNGDTEKIDSEIVSITGATVSSQATVKILNDHIESLKSILKDKGLIEQ